MQKQALKRTLAIILALVLALTPILSSGIYAGAEEYSGDEPAGVESGEPQESELPEELLDGEVPEESQEGEMPEDPLGNEVPVELPDGEVSGEPLENEALLEPLENKEPELFETFSLFADEPELFAITITEPANGTVTANMESAEAGATVELTVTAADAYKLSPGSISVITTDQLAPRQIRGTGSADDPYTFIMPAVSVVVKAVFVRICTVTVADGIEHGVITTDVTSGVAGETVRVTVTPDEGYRLKFYSTTNNPNKSLKATYGEAATSFGFADYLYDPNTGINTDLNVAATSYSFAMPAGDVVITAEFTEALALNIADNLVNGTVNLNGRTVAGEGERVPALSVADAGYQLVAGSVTVTNSSTQEPVNYYTTYQEFIMPDSAVVISAEFEPMPKLENLDFTVTPGDSEMTCTFNVPAQWFSATINYRIKDSGDTFKTQSAYTGNTAIGSPFSVKVTGLTNDAEYEVYLSSSIGGSEVVYATPAGILPTGVSLSRTSANVVLGETMSLYAEVLPTDSKAKGLTWSSSNEDVATVGEHGVVTTKALGYTKITVTSDVGGHTAICDVTVVESSATPSGGSMILGTVDAVYGKDGGTVDVPLTVIVPTDRPIFEFDFSPAPGTAAAAYYSVTAISLNGVSLAGNATTAVDDLNIRIGTALPLTANYSYAVIVATPQTGRFLEAGKTYEFVLTVEIKSTAPPVIPISFSSSTNYRAAFYYYDYDYSPSRDRYAEAALRQPGTINAIWTGDGEIPPSGGSGLTAAYYISTPEHLVWYAEQWNTGETTFGATLFADLDLTGTAFDGIGTAEAPYTGRFSGNNKTVTYNLTQDGDGAVGLFRYITGGYVNNLTTRGTVKAADGTVNAGGIAGEIGGNAFVNNCINYVDVTVTGTAGGYAGGVAGYVESTTTTYAGPVGNCTNYGTILADGENVVAVGGIAGYVKNPNRLSGAGNGGGSREAVGVAGAGEVTGRGYVGGIVGIFENTSVKELTDNTNFSPVTGLDGTATGGVAGKVVMAHVGGTYNGADRTQYPNRNYSDVTGATKYVGGIAGTVDNIAAERIALNFNTGKITSTATVSGAAVGGIIAHTTGSETVTIADNTNIGELAAASGAIMGGVLGTSDNTLSQTLCTGNYYAEVEGLGDAVFSRTAPAGWLSIDGWSPQYSGAGGDGSADNPYQIATFYDFLWFTKQVNSGSEPGNSPGMNYCVILTTDIDLTEYPAYEGIGTSSYPSQTYHGTFDGNGHTITVALDGTTTGGQALMGRMAIFRSCSGATIKNLTVRGSVIGSLVAGVALQFDGGVLENVHNYANITNVHDEARHYEQYASNGQAAGIFGSGSPTLMKNVTNHGIIYGHNAAGLANTIVSSAIIEDCLNEGDVTACMLAAGIVGSMGAGGKSTDGKPSLIIRNTRNEGTITSKAPVVLDNVAWYNNGDPSTNHTAGGIIGKIDNAIVELNNVTNNGTVQGSGNNIGGILGTSVFGDYQDTDFRIINSTNNGTVRSTYNGDTDWHLSHISVGGIVGNTSGTFDMSSVWNPYGSPGHTQKATITGSVNNGTVSGPKGANVGAIAGLVTGNPDSGSVINIGNNYTSKDVEGSGSWNNVDGEKYDIEKYEVVDGKLVELQAGEGPEVPVPAPPVTPPNQNNAGGSADSGSIYIPERPETPLSAAPETPEISDNNRPNQPAPEVSNPPPATENYTPRLPEPTELDSSSNTPSARFMPVSSNPRPAEPIILELDNEETPLAAAPSQDSGTTQNEDTQQQPMDPANDVPVPQVADISIDPSGINPAFIIIPLIAIIVIIGAIGFIRFRRKQRA